MSDTAITPVAFVPANLYDKYEERLREYSKNSERIDAFVKEKLVMDEDYGYTMDGGKKNSKDRPTLMKPGGQKILKLMECKIKFYPDVNTWKMIYGKPGAVCYVGYIIDQELLSMIIPTVAKLGIEHEEKIVKLFAWGEGRGAYEIDEKCYSNSTKPLKGSVNRAIKLAQKRTEIDAVIRTFGLKFYQDEDYGNDGRLKGDKDKNKPRPKQEKPKLPPKNQELFNDGLKLLNDPILTGPEKIQYKKNLDMVAVDFNQLNSFMGVLHSVIKDRKEKRNDKD